MFYARVTNLQKCYNGHFVTSRVTKWAFEWLQMSMKKLIFVT